MSEDGKWRIIRTLLQLLAGGGIGTLLAQIADDVPDKYDPYIFLLSAALTAIAQIVYEEVRNTKIVGPEVVAKPAAQEAVTKAYVATPGVDPKPVIK